MMVPAWVGVVWGYVVKGGSALMASVAALLASPAVWLACGAVFVGGFSVGHWERSKVLRSVKSDLAQTADDRAALQKAVTQLEAKLGQALQEGQAFSAALNEARAELAAKASAPAPAPAKSKSAKKEPLK